MRLLEFTALSSLLVLFLLLAVSAEQCGRQAGGARCPSGMCCSNFGWCGNTQDYCGRGKCQSQCPSGPGPTPRPPTPTPGPSTGDISSIISSSMFDQMLKHRNDNACQGKDFTLTMPLSVMHDHFVASAPRVTPQGVKGRLLLSLPKPLMKLPVSPPAMLRTFLGRVIEFV